MTAPDHIHQPIYYLSTGSMNVDGLGIMISSEIKQL